MPLTRHNIIPHLRKRTISHAPTILTTTRLLTTPRPSSTMARTYESALSHLASIQSNRAITSLFTPTTPITKDLNAQAIPEMLAWLARAGLKTTDLAQLNCIHVAGTKGKGSVCAYLTSLLLCQPAAGRVGTYTSPHLVSVRERIQLDGQPISQALFARYFFEVWDAFEAAGTEKGAAAMPFYFRFLTIMAFLVFLREGVRSAVIECGIGGEYDSTNVLPGEAVTACVVTQLGIDHVGMLGHTLPEIAWHKIGIAKTGRRCFTRRLGGEEREETMEVMRRRTGEKGAELVEVADQDVEEWGGVGTAGALEGSFQQYNQALAVAAAKEHLRVLGGGGGALQLETALSLLQVLQDLPEGFTEGLQQARLRGRCETIQEDNSNTTWLIDGAHTAESLREVARWYVGKRKSLDGDARHVLVFNQQERDAGKLLAGLYKEIRHAAGPSFKDGVFDKAIFTRNELHAAVDGEPSRDLSVQELAFRTYESCDPQAKRVVCDNIADAVKCAKEATKDEDYPDRKTVVLVTGSLHLVGALLQTLEPNASR